MGYKNYSQSELRRAVKMLEDPSNTWKWVAERLHRDDNGLRKAILREGLMPENRMPKARNGKKKSRGQRHAEALAIADFVVLAADGQFHVHSDVDAALADVAAQHGKLYQLKPTTLRAVIADDQK